MTTGHSSPFALCMVMTCSASSSASARPSISRSPSCHACDMSRAKGEDPSGRIGASHFEEKIGVRQGTLCPTGMSQSQYRTDLQAIHCRVEDIERRRGRLACQRLEDPKSLCRHRVLNASGVSPEPEFGYLLRVASIFRKIFDDVQQLLFAQPPPGAPCIRAPKARRVAAIGKNAGNGNQGP